VALAQQSMGMGSFAQQTGSSCFGSNYGHSSGMSSGASVLQPARHADPNHPLRPGTAQSPLDDSVCTSSAMDVSMMSASNFDDLQPADKLISSVTSALDALNVARASNNRFAMSNLVDVLAQAQLKIVEAIGPEASLSGPQGGARTPVPGTPSHVGANGVPQLFLGGNSSARHSAYDAVSSALPSARSSMGDFGDFGAGRDPNLSVISGQSSVDVENILERYSDRLVEMMARKMSNLSMDATGSISVRSSSRAGGDESRSASRLSEFEGGRASRQGEYEGQ